MNVIVKGMKMPDCCVECELNDSDDDGIYCTALEVFMRFDELPKGRRSDCPLAELIRCKDCKFHCDRTRCKKRIGAWFDDDYCNGAVMAERKEE